MLQMVWRHETTMSIAPSIRKKLSFFKAPALIVLILVGFILEFLIEWPFRFVTLTAGDRRPSGPAVRCFDFIRSIRYR